MIRLLKWFRQSTVGATTVEFALSIIIFLLTLGVLLEFCRIAILGGCFDWAVSVASKQIKNESQIVNLNDYKNKFKDHANRNIQSTGVCDFVSNNDIEADIWFFKNIEDLKQYTESGRGANVDDISFPIAMYMIKYPYKALFFFAPSFMTDGVFERRILNIQEMSRGAN
ncbi:TadE/TadG family type IV pilus assembly protein [Basilea psittacipulmonis]|uniref:Pilus assembly protein TadE n=2 Tax=Basilea TaxID=1472344 RepID=A0A077DCN5_9BURK|nr:TadE family protein [Basilea psittacipulmonis]AIL32364.1 hypothetical protein IX83_02670 [Basilea psittacipulmonis DSM 24701]